MVAYQRQVRMAVMAKRKGAKPGEFGQEGYEYDAKTAATVRRLGASLARAEDVAAAVGMSRAALYRHYGEELQAGAASSKLKLLAKARKTIEGNLTDVKVAQWAFERFSDPYHVGRPGAALLTDDGEKGEVGGVLVVPAVSSVEDWLEAERKRNESKSRPGCGNRERPAEDC